MNMAFQKSYDEPKALAGPACVYLRSKSLYVSGDLKSLDRLDESHSQHCWCNLTQHVRGPDQQAVDRGTCVPGRECYRDCH